MSYTIDIGISALCLHQGERAGVVAARLVNVQLVELEAPIDTGRPGTTSPDAAAGSGAGHAPSAYLVDVQLVEIEARDRRRPAQDDFACCSC